MPPRRTRDSSPIATNGSGRRRRTPSSSRPRESSSRQASSGDRDSRDNMVVGSTSNHNKKPSRHQETKQRDDDHRNRRASSGKTRHQSQSSNSHSNSQQRRPSQRRSSSKRSPSPVRTYRQGHASPIKGSPDRPSKSQSHSRSHNSNSHSRHRTMDHSDRQQIQGHKSPYQEDKDKSHSNSKSHRSSSTRPKKVQLKRSSTTDGHREDFGHGHSRRSSTSHRSSSTRGHVDIVDHSRSDNKLNSSYNEKHSSQSQQRSSRGHVDIVDHSRSESKLSSSYNEKHSQPQQQQLRPSSDVKLSSSYNEKKSQSSQQQQPRPSSSSRGLPDDLRRSTGSGYSDSHHHHRSYTSKSSTGSGRSHNEQRSLDFDAHAHRRQSSSDGNHHHHHQQQQQQSQQRPRPVSSSRSMDERRENDNRSTPVPSSSKSYHGSPITKSTSQPTPKRTTKKTNSSSASDAVDRLLAQAEGCLAPTRADARRKSVSSKSASADHVDRLLACAEECLVNNPSPNSTNNNGRNTPSSSAKDTRGRDKSVNSIISRISRVRQQASRSRSKSRDGRLSSMMRSKSGERSTNGSAVTLATKSISSSGSQAEHLAREILTVSKCPVTPPSAGQTAPRRPPPPLHRSASVGALGNQGDLGGQLCLVPYNGGEGSQGPMSTTRSHQSSSIALNESREGALSPRNHAPPPPPYTKRMSCSDIQLRHSLSNNDFSPGAGSYNAVNRKPTPPPPPPPRRPASRASMTASGISLNNITEDTSYNHGNATDANYNNGNAMPMYNGPINPPPQQTAIIPFAEITTTNNDDNSNPTKGGKKDLNKPRETHLVSQMSYTDHHGDTGIYTGEVDNESRPHGKGKMRYDNGIFYEGNWIQGKQDHAQGTSDQMANVTRERIMSGFTSWKGQRSQKNLKEGIGDQGTYVYGMEWVDRTGMAGKYTGHVDANDDPDGKGIMRYEFGLVAEGEWIKGVLNDGQGMGAMGAATVAAGGGMTVAPGGAMSVAPGMSVAGGGQSVVSGLGMMSIVGGGMGMGGMGCGFPRAGMGMMNPYMGGMNAMQATPSVAPMSYYQPVGAGMMAGAGSVAPSQYGGMMYHPQQGTGMGMGGGMNAVPTNLAAPPEQRQLL